MGQNENYENTSLYFFGSKSLRKLNFSIGARFENNVISLDSYFKPSDKKIRRINSFNPSVNFLYEFDKIDVFANFSSGYETPTLNELSATSNQTGFNNDLKNIKSNTFEIGFANLKNDNIINYSNDNKNKYASLRVGHIRKRKPKRCVFLLTAHLLCMPLLVCSGSS